MLHKNEGSVRNPNTYQVSGFLSLSILLWGVNQEILPCSQGRIDPLNLILPCKWGILIEDIICSWCYYLRSFYQKIIKIGINGEWVMLDKTQFKLLLLHGKNAWPIFQNYVAYISDPVLFLCRIASFLFKGQCPLSLDYIVKWYGWNMCGLLKTNFLWNKTIQLILLKKSFLF